MNEDSCSRVLFRLQHLIPRLLTSVSLDSKNIQNSAENRPQEIQIQMTWGKICGKVWGPENGKPVFALHGWLDNAGSFDTLIPLLPIDLRIVCIETPGHGLSDHFPPDIAYNFMDSLVAIERISAQLKWPKFSFLAHSLGGCAAMMYSSIFPEKVEKLILLDIVRVTPTITQTVDLRLRKTVGKLLKYEAAIVSGPEKPISYEAAVEKCISGTFGSLDLKASEIMLKRGLKKVEGGYNFTRDRRLLAAPLSFSPKEDQLYLAKKMTADVLIIKYSEGPFFESVEDYMEHVEALKASKAKIVKYIEVEGRHHAHLTNPEVVAPLISDFFNS